MYPTWPMVFAALVAGALAGFMLPDRPESRPASPVQAQSRTQPSSASAPPAKPDDIRAVSLTRAASSEPADASKPKRSETPSGCAAKTWPYRIAGCLDRTASVTPASTVVKVKRIDPAATLAANATPAKAEEKAATSRMETAPTKQKVVAAPAPAEKREAEPRPAPAADSPRAAAHSEPDRDAPRRPQRRLSRDIDFNDGIPTRVYLRGPDGRLYLAPEHRPTGQYRYYVR